MSPTEVAHLREAIEVVVSEHPLTVDASEMKRLNLSLHVALAVISTGWRPTVGDDTNG